jgi:hypothetical protein
MNIPIVIPTYKRSHLIISRTLNLLERLEYPQENIFVVVGCFEDQEFDYWDYFNSITELYPDVNILVGDNSNAKASQLNFIRNELLEPNQLALILDDDIVDIFNDWEKDWGAKLFALNYGDNDQRESPEVIEFSEMQHFL